MRGLPIHGAMAAASRLEGAAGAIRAAPWAEASVLVLLGAAAAFLTLNVDLDLRVPGHAILRCVLPFSLGLALVPRSGAGTVMGSAALAALLVQGIDKGAPGWGSATSLVLAGPALDLAARSARSGRGVYLALILGGTAANLAAFAVRLGAKVLAPGGNRPLASWWPEAILTYTLCGVAAGALSAAVWFRFRSPGDAR